MSYGYLGDTSTSIKQQVKNAGVLSVSDVLDLEGKGQLGGSLELIEEKSISASSSAIFTDIKETVYDVHFMTLNNFQASDDSQFPAVRFFESGVEESANVYQYALQYGRADGTFGASQALATNFLTAGATTGNQVNEQCNSYSYFYNLGNSSKYSFQTLHTTITSNTTTYTFSFGGGVLPQTSTVDQIKLFVLSGTFSATAKLYGVKQL